MLVKTYCEYSRIDKGKVPCELLILPIHNEHEDAAKVLDFTQVLHIVSGAPTYIRSHPLSGPNPIQSTTLHYAPKLHSGNLRPSWHGGQRIRVLGHPICGPGPRPMRARGGDGRLHCALPPPAGVRLTRTDSTQAGAPTPWQRRNPFVPASIHK